MTEVGWARRFPRCDVVAVTTLLAVPLIVLSTAAIAGYPLLTGDDLIQSFGLSVLSAQIISHGHLPLYDPYLWSGSPLLGAANAHALLPTTLLFTFLPHLAAWVVAEALTLWAGAVGCFVLLRRNGCRTLSAALGAASFGLGGYVSSQIVHIDFVSAAASLAWSLVALDGIAMDPAHRRPAWALLLAVAVACVALSASPDIVIDAVVVLVFYGLHLFGAARGRRGAFLAWAGAGAVTGLLASAVQWLPTADFLRVSERAQASYAFASSGSVSPAELLVSVVPHVLGGGPLGLKTYAGPYNLAEIDAYGGVLSLVAIAALAARWRGDGAWRWRVWYLVGGLGVLLALGAHTPLERLLVRLPLVGEQRLPSRALVLFALASSMLLGFWVEGVLSSEQQAGPSASAKPSRPRFAPLASGLVAPCVVLGLIVATALSGRPYGGLLEALSGSGWTLSAVAPYLAVEGAIALGAGAVVVLGPRWPRRRLARVIGLLVVADLVVFAANQSSLAPTYSRALGVPNTLQAELSARLANGGRYVIVDPARSAGIALDEVGAPDLGQLFGLASAQGYGSLTWGPYASATGTHSQDDLDPAALATGVFDSLDVRVLLTVPGELSLHGNPHETPGSGPAQPTGLGAPPIAGVGEVPSPIDLGAGQAVSRWFGRSLQVGSVTLEVSGPLASASELAALGSRVRLLPADGGLRAGGRGRVVLPVPGTIVVTFSGGPASDGLVVPNPLRTSVRIAAVAVTTRSGVSYGLDGALAAYLTAPHWVAAGAIGPFVVFADTRARGAFWPAGPASSPAGRLRVRVVSSSPWTATETVAITSPVPATVMRSVAGIPGWQATEQQAGHTRTVTVRTVGLVQAFAVPSGSTLVTLTYEPPGLRSGLVLSALGIAGLLVLAVAAFGRRRRRLEPSEAAEAPHVRNVQDSLATPSLRSPT